MGEYRMTSVETGHVGLNVTDLARARDFYREAFGLTVASESTEPGRAYAFLAVGGRLVLTLWQQAGGPFEAARSGLHHLSFQVPTLEDVRAIEGRVRALDARIYHGGIVSHAEGARSGGLYFDDPDGIRLEVFASEGLSDFPPATPGAPSCGFF